MKKKTITKAVILTATILVLTGCNSNTSTNPTEPVTTTTVEQEVETSTEETTTTTTSSSQETETSSTSTEQVEETTTVTTDSDESTIPETTVEIETTTQVAGYDGICEEYGHAETINGADCFILDEGAPMAAWKDALSKYKWVSDDSEYFYTTMEYRGHTVLYPDPDQGVGDEDEDAYSGSSDYLWHLGLAWDSPFIYDMDLNLVGTLMGVDSLYGQQITDQEVRDGVTWYKYHLGEDCDYWLPEHNGADWEQIYKKYVQEPYEARYAVMTDEEKVNENLFDYEQVWNKTYYNIIATGDGGYILVEKMYAYKNADGSITQSAGWEYCDTSIFDGTSLLEHGETGKGSSGCAWKYDGNTLIDNTEYNALASEFYYHLIDLYGEECVRWNDHDVWNGETYHGEHDWDVYGDGKDGCKSIEEHIAKCQGN